MIHIDKHHHSLCVCDLIGKQLSFDVYYNGKEFVIFSYNSCLQKYNYDFFVEPLSMNLGLSVYENTNVDRACNLNEELKNFRLISCYTMDRFRLVSYICESSNGYKKILSEKVDLQFYLENLTNIDNHVEDVYLKIDSEKIIRDISKCVLKQKVEALRDSNFILLSEKETSISINHFADQLKRKNN